MEADPDWKFAGESSDDVTISGKRIIGPAILAGLMIGTWAFGLVMWLLG